jgi:hypothetical protein
MGTTIVEYMRKRPLHSIMPGIGRKHMFLAHWQGLECYTGFYTLHITSETRTTGKLDSLYHARCHIIFVIHDDYCTSSASFLRSLRWLQVKVQEGILEMSTVQGKYVMEENYQLDLVVFLNSLLERTCAERRVRMYHSASAAQQLKFTRC